MLSIIKIETQKKKEFKNKNPLAPQWPFRFFVYGPSGSGKTNMILNLIYHHLLFDTITIYAKNQDQDVWEELIEILKSLEEELEVSFTHIGTSVEDILPIESYNKELQNLIIFDDFLNDKKMNKQVKDYFTRSRHKNCSIIYLAQKYYEPSDNSLKTIRDNCNYFALFKGMAGTSLDFAYRDLGGHLTKETFFKMYHEATQKPYDFLLVDKKTEEPALQFRKNFDELFTQE